MWGKYLWLIWLGFKFSQSCGQGSVRMISLVLLLLSALVMAIRAKKEWALWFLAPHHSQLVASLHPSYMAAELIVCLVLWMIKPLWATGSHTLQSICRRDFAPRPCHSEFHFFALFIGQWSISISISNSHSNISINSRIQRAITGRIIHSFCLEGSGADPLDS